MNPMNRSLTALTAALLAGCAGPTLDAQWRDPQLTANYLRGARVLVACEAAEVVLQRICEDQLSLGLKARGAVPVVGAAPADAAAARSAGAKAVFNIGVNAASRAVSPGFQIGFGLGSFGSNVGGGVGGGVGVSAPVGGGKVTSGYAANGRITDAASTRLMWSARAAAAPSSDVNAQLADLTKAVLDAADKAGLF